MTISAPRWDLTNVYPSLKSDEFKAAIDDYKKQVAALEKFFKTKLKKTDAKTKAKELAPRVGKAIDQINKIQTLSATIVPFIYSYVTTNSRNKVATKTLSEFEQASLPMNQLLTQFTAWLGTIAPKLDKVIANNNSATAHEFMLREAAEQSKYLMSDEEEALAAELSLSGGNAFEKLQGTVTSQLSVDFELDGKTEKMPMPALINLRSHPDEATRHRAYDAENQAWETVKETLAACLNGVKGETNTLNKKRAEKTQSILPWMRRDGSQDARSHARSHEKFLPRCSANISMPRLRKSARKNLPGGMSSRRSAKPTKCIRSRKPVISSWKTLANSLRIWQRSPSAPLTTIGSMPNNGTANAAAPSVWKYRAVKESRVLCNFDGSFDQVSTLAHELGHAFHNECAYQANKTMLQQLTPMTLAETASTMCETIVTEAVLASTQDPQEELAVLEAQIQSAAQVVVDIYARYLFEKEVFERREQSELSADDFNDIMEHAQKETYGDELDEKYLQKFMWTWKPHYYSPGLSFYNYPYAFGLLFATGLYAIYQQRGEAFVAITKTCSRHERRHRCQAGQTIWHQYHQAQVLGRQPGDYREAY